MATKKEKNGLWTATITYSINGKIYHTDKRGFESKRDAQKYEILFRETNTRESMIKFGKVVERFMTEKKTNRKVSTTDEISRIHLKYFSFLDSRDIRKMRLADFQEVKNKLVKVKLSATYKNKILSVLKSVSKFMSIHFEMTDYARNVTRFSNNDIVEHMSIWTPEEFDLFESYVLRDIYKDYFRVLFMTGVRAGEGRALYKTDLKNKYLSINKSIRHAKDGVTSPKNRYSVRVIALDNKTNEILLRYCSRTGKFMFGNVQPLAESSVGRVFQTAIKQAQIEHPSFCRIRLHDLRHSHASYLINRGANIVAVSKRLGHSSVEVTLRVYTHLMKENEIRLVAILNDDEAEKSELVETDPLESED